MRTLHLFSIMFIHYLWTRHYRTLISRLTNQMSDRAIMKGTTGERYDELVFEAECARRLRDNHWGRYERARRKLEERHG